jgi:hypothetical protein
MRLKIRGGTARDDEPSLCLTCRHATIIRGKNLRDEIIECGLLYREDSRMTFPVTSCSGYSDRRHPSLRQMEEIAWVLRTDRGKRRIGFVPARELRPKERYVLDDDDWS